MPRGFFEDHLKKFCQEKFGAGCWVEGSYKDDQEAGTVEFTIRATDAAKDAPVVSLEALEELSLRLGTCHIFLQPTESSLPERVRGLVSRPGIRFAALRAAFICPG